MVEVNRKGSSVRRWDQIQATFFSQSSFISSEAKSKVVFLCRNGQRETFKGWEGFEDLKLAIIRRTSDRLLEEAYRDWCRFQTVVFGPDLRLDGEGVTVRRTLIPWQNVEGVLADYSKNKLKFRISGRMLFHPSVPLDSLANFFIVPDLVARIRSFRHGSKRSDNLPGPGGQTHPGVDYR